ncbi:glycoside hydrolase family 20 zincin-like fold domain-containing protein [Poriferisphaera sp. WC338]|uniref:beta-N-acetylhexosaminidase n=1 Tax=Poriferisphaera sp. WC338 TaxID=3425129 RepID=UPI003D815E6A
MILAPMPRELDVVGSTLSISTTMTFTYQNLEEADQQTYRHLLKNVLTICGADPEATGIDIALGIDADTVEESQGYTLVVDEKGIKATGHDAAGLFYAMMTLKQMAKQCKGTHALPMVQVKDHPDFAVRGVMMDISRDKVPTMGTLRMLVDMFAELKLNQVQLYMEHTFAYEGHEVVWEKASPMTGVEIEQLDAICKERHIELVPNQNSFGHLERWLKHEPYNQVAEAPEGYWRTDFPDPWWVAHPVSLCPIDPGSIELLDDLYGKLLPHFSSGQFNVGMDETFDLGKGRSKDVCEDKGQGRVYLDYLLKVYELASKKYGKRVQFWADILLHYPELVNELPKDIVALNWGYEEEHPFDKECKLLEEAGVPFYVCPSTCTFLCIMGRWDNTMANLKNAAFYGKKHGAEGYLITDWGDNGHWQPLLMSYQGYVYGAGVSWCESSNRELDVAKALDVLVYDDAAGVIGETIKKIGRLEVQTQATSKNILGWTLMRPECGYAGGGEVKMPWKKVGPMTKELLKDAHQTICEAIQDIEQTDIQIQVADQVKREFLLGAELLKLSAEMNLARVEEDAAMFEDISAKKRAVFAKTLEDYIPRYKESWLARNREGGLADSVGRFETILNQLKQ